MLDKKAFEKGIKYLDAYYSNFNFDLQNEIKAKVWYDKFKALDTNTFTTLIKNYCDRNVYAPQSPTDLLNHVAVSCTEEQLDPDAAWDLTIRLGRKYSFYYGIDKIYKELEPYPLVKQTVEEFYRRLIDLRTDDNYTQRDFKASYKSKLEVYGKEQASLILNSNTQIGTSEKKLLK